jgi:argininosuccinate synthase
MPAEKSCVLAYSGGLDTSAIVPWLRERGYEVHALLVDVGQAEDLFGLCDRALAMGAATATVRDARQAMADGVLGTSVALASTYEGNYRLGTALARPFIALEQVKLARELGASVLAHGATGKGNDQIRFEFAYRTLAPDCEIVAPWKSWSFRGREDLVAYLDGIGAPVQFDATKELSLDENLWHLSVEGGALEDPTAALNVEYFLAAVQGRFFADRPADPGDDLVTVEFEEGLPASVDGEPMGLLDLIGDLNARFRHADWAWDLVLENRFTGIKSRGLYINPAARLLHLAADVLARATLNKHAYDQYVRLGHEWADLLYRGEYFTPQCAVIRSAADAAVRPLTGSVEVRLSPQLHVCRIEAAGGLFEEEMATFEASQYDHADANGFIKLGWLSSTGRPQPWKESPHGHALEAEAAPAPALR